MLIMVTSYMRWEGDGLEDLDESLQLDRFVLDDSRKKSSFATGKKASYILISTLASLIFDR